MINANYFLYIKLGSNSKIVGH